MGERRDYIAIKPDGGVYALCSVECDAKTVREFIDEALGYGDTVQLVSTDEAVKRHRVYLATLPVFASRFPSPDTRGTGEA